MEALKMEDHVDSWNDDRLDELSRRVDDGFKEMKGGFARVDREMKEGFSEVRGEMRYLGERFDRLQHTLMAMVLGFTGTMGAAVVGLVVFLV